MGILDYVMVTLIILALVYVIYQLIATWRAYLFKKAEKENDSRCLRLGEENAGLRGNIDTLKEQMGIKDRAIVNLQTQKISVDALLQQALHRNREYETTVAYLRAKVEKCQEEMNLK